MFALRIHYIEKYIHAHGQAAVRFVAATLIAMIFNFGGTWLLHEVWGVGPQKAFAIVLVLVYVVNFTLVRFWVFTSRQNIYKQMMSYVMVSLCFRCSEYLVFTLLYTVLGLYYMLAVFISLFSLYCIKFIVYRFFVFK